MLFSVDCSSALFLLEELLAPDSRCSAMGSFSVAVSSGVSSHHVTLREKVYDPDDFGAVVSNCSGATELESVFVAVDIFRESVATELTCVLGG